jgi:hypothetical protein
MAKKKSAKKAMTKSAKKKSAKKTAKKKTSKKKGVIARMSKGMSDAMEYAGDAITSPFSSRKGKKKAKRK